jgi:hypothetical protein
MTTLLMLLLLLLFAATNPTAAMARCRSLPVLLSGGGFDERVLACYSYYAFPAAVATTPF